MVPLIVIATSTLQMTDAVAGSTLFNVVRTLAGSVGGAVVGSILVVRERVHSNAIVDHLVAGAPTTPAQSPKPMSIRRARGWRLKLNVPLYDPIGHYDATRGRWYGTTPAQ